MKKLRLVSELILIGALLCSCVDRDIDIEQNPDDGFGFLALGIGINGVGDPSTRAADPNYHHPSEYALNSLRIILYDDGTGLALDVADYLNIAYTSLQQWTYEVRSTGATSDPTFTISGEEYDPQMTKYYTNIDRSKTYKLLVIANPFESDGTGGGAHLDNIILSDNSTLLAATSAAGHALSLVEQAKIDYNEPQYGGNAATIYDNVASTWMGIKTLSYPGGLSYTGKMSNASFMMFNADNDYSDPYPWGPQGLQKIIANNIRPSLSEARQFPVLIRLERGVAKVIVADGMTLLSHGAVAGNVTWVCDILNRKSYILRKGVVSATSNGLVRETLSTPQSKRYALDPNYENTSMESWIKNYSYMPSPPPLEDNFFRFAATDQNALFFRSLAADADNPAGFNWEYVPENTTNGADQYQDAVTRILVRCDYHPHLSQYLGNSPGADANGSYYSYKGHVFSIADMNALATGDVESNVKTMVEHYNKLELLSLTDVLTSSALRINFGGFTGGGPSMAVSDQGLNFHYGPGNYYAVPIRHFDDKQVPISDADYNNEGRYGVVRNNVYKITITNISGPGSSVIPEPKGYCDREFGIETMYRVTPWNTVSLNFDF